MIGQESISQGRLFRKKVKEVSYPTNPSTGAAAAAANQTLQDSKKETWYPVAKAVFLVLFLSQFNFLCTIYLVFSVFDNFCIWLNLNYVLGFCLLYCMKYCILQWFRIDQLVLKK